jgi:hypothetical protein
MQEARLMPGFLLLASGIGFVAFRTLIALQTDVFLVNVGP